MCVAMHASKGQETISIEQCYTLAEQNYPLIKQRDLISKSKDFSIMNANRSRLPQFSINGQATYQSEVTQLPIKIPGNDIPTISKDQYKIYGEVNQTLVDGGTTKVQRETLEANALLEEEKLATDLYKLRERVNQLFFGILMTDEQLKQNDIVRKDLQSGIVKTNAAIANGIALKSSGDVLQAELLKNDQRQIELKSSRRAFIDMLSLFLNRTLTENVVLQKPMPAVPLTEINRHELRVFEHQNKLLDVQRELINAKNRPRVSLFLQAGYGRPALNFLNNDFTSYYIGGIRFSWLLSGLYTRKNEQSLIAINRNSLEVQKEVFLFNTTFTLKQQSADIARLQELAKTDNEIIALRSRIKNTALVQVENGVINSNDYLREVNAEDMAKQNQLLHEIQLLMAQYNQQVTAGN